VTEDEWLACDDPNSMMSHVSVGGRVSERKLRLFAVACCRRIWHLLVHDASREAVDVGERFADGQASNEELDDAYQEADDVWQLLQYAFNGLVPQPDNEYAQAVTAAGVHPFAAAEATEAPIAVVENDADALAAYIPAARAVAWAGASTDYDPDAQAKALEAAAQAELFRDLCGPLAFRPLAPVAPELLDWNDGVVHRLAEEIYVVRKMPEGTFDAGRLAVLADALEDAGCTDADVVAHLRSPGPHVRGCWVIDWLLGKE
jgi:hypothetical protein